MEIDHDRRRFLGRTALTMAAAPLGLFRHVEARQPRELAAIGRASTWLNSPRLAPADLLGKVVVVDFCTYSCINWLRTLPYIRAWAQKYAQGLVVLGVHTPEFAFEQNADHVRRAVAELKLAHPIVMDNDYAIWRAFGNQYWPALYFLDPRGRIRDRHFGEGEYERSEKTMQRLLTDAGGSAVPTGLVAVSGGGAEAAADWSNLRSPEMYLGYERTQDFASPGGVAADRRRTYTAPERLGLNQWALAGDWTAGRQAMALASAGGRIVCRFHARDLHLVMGPPGLPASAGRAPIRFRVTIDGQPPGPARGVDVDDGGNGMAIEPRMYQLIRQPAPIRDRRFDVEFLDAGVEAFAFTFG